MVYTTQQKEEIALRFSPETKVECLFAGCWVQAVVRSCWYQEDGWPADTWSPYQLELENGSLIFAPADDNRMIRLSAPSPLALRLVPTVAAVKAEAGMEEAAGGEEAPASPAVVAEFGAMRLSDSLFDLCDVELPSPTRCVPRSPHLPFVSNPIAAHALTLARPGSNSSAGGLFPSGQSTDSLPPLGRSSFSTDSSASARNLFSDPFASETDCPGLADSLPRMSTHGPRCVLSSRVARACRRSIPHSHRADRPGLARSIPQLFSADESSLVLEEVSNDMHISPYASSAAAAAANPWCSELSPLPSVGQSERSEGAARVYKMSLARSMTDEAEQFKQDVLAIKSEAGAQGEPEPAAPGPLVVSTESLRRPGGLWADFGAPPALTPAANFQFSQQQQQQPPPQQQQSRRAEEPQDPHELRARAASGPPRLEMHGEYEKQIGRLRGLQEMLMHARAEFGLTDRRCLSQPGGTRLYRPARLQSQRADATRRVCRYLEVRRRVVACEAGLSTFCTGPHESFDLNPLSVSGEKRPVFSPVICAEPSKPRIGFSRLMADCGCFCRHRAGAGQGLAEAGGGAGERLRFLLKAGRLAGLPAQGQEEASDAAGPGP